MSATGGELLSRESFDHEVAYQRRQETKLLLRSIAILICVTLLVVARALVL